MLAEQHDEWQVARRYMSSETIAIALKPALEVLETKEEEEAVPALMAD